MTEGSKPMLSIITVNYGSSEKIQNLRDSLLRFPPSQTWEWIVVDNASARNDGDKLDEILKDIPQAHLVKLQKNIGFGGGNQEGVHFAHGEILAFINPDIEVEEKCLDTLLEELQEEKRGIVTPQLQNQDGKKLENTWDFPTMWGLASKRLFGNHSQHQEFSEAHSVPWAQGSFLVLKKELFGKLGGFDDRFFLFFEDTDLCRRTWEMGFHVVQVPEAKAIHSEHRLSGKDIFGSLLRKTFWIHVVSMMKYFWKWRGKKKPDIS